jgi:hypothetical protein
MDLHRNAVYDTLHPYICCLLLAYVFMIKQERVMGGRRLFGYSEGPRVPTSSASH